MSVERGNVGYTAGEIKKKEEIKRKKASQAFHKRIVLCHVVASLETDRRTRIERRFVIARFGHAIASRRRFEDRSKLVVVGNYIVIENRDWIVRRRREVEGGGREVRQI